jgi:hypothetical protein
MESNPLGRRITPLGMPPVVFPDSKDGKRQLEHRVSLSGGDFILPESFDKFMAAVYGPQTLRWIRIKVGLVALLSVVLFNSTRYDMNQDIACWFFRIIPPVLLVFTVATLDVKTPATWVKRHCHVTLLSAIIFMIGTVYLHVITFDYESEKIVRPESAACSHEAWLAADNLFAAFVGTHSLYLVLVVYITKHAFNMRFRQLLIIVPCAMICEAVFVFVAYDQLRSLGCGKQTTWQSGGIIHLKSHLGMCVAFALFLYETRVHDLLVINSFIERAHLSNRVVSLETRSSSSLEPANMRESLNELGSMASDGTVEMLLHQALSLDKTVRDNASRGIRSYIASARVVVPATAKAAQKLKTKPATTSMRKRNWLLEAGASGVAPSMDDQLRRVAAAKTGLEVAQAWISRIMGTSWDVAAENKSQVFLGGSCNPTTWRKDIAIPRLSAVGIPFYNPQVDDWHPGLVDEEAKAKEEADVLLFIIDNETRSLASVVEAAEHIVRGRNVVLSIVDAVPTGDIQDAELKDLNRMRSYLRDVATRHAVPWTSSVPDAIDVVIRRVKGETARSESTNSARSENEQAADGMTMRIMAMEETPQESPPGAHRPIA